MGLGVLEDKHLEHVPGTAPLAEVLAARDLTNLQDTSHTAHLKHGTGKDKDIILIPQPSDSPRDPLNWSLWKKDLMLFIICIDTAVVGAWGPMISPGFGIMSVEFNISYNDLNGKLGWGIFLIGVSCFITNGLAVKFGKRPVFLGGNLVLFISSIWASQMNSFNGLLASRLFGCIGMSPFEVLVTATITDIYFVHQRGMRLAAWGLCLSIGVGASGIISGYVIQDLGWQWTYKLTTILFGIHIPLLYFFCPETCYKRSADLNIDLGTINHAKELEAELEEIEAARAEGKHTSEQLEKTATQLEAQLADQHGANEPPWTKWEELRLWRGIESGDNLLKIIIRPFPMLLFPQVLYAFITYGLTTSWLIVLLSVAALIFGGPPYNFSVGNIGLLGIAGLIVSILGFIAGPINDYLCKWLARRNNGIYEPEFRLVSIVLTFVFGTMGFFGFGISLHNYDPWIGPVMFQSIMTFGASFLNIAVYGYITDCLRDHAPEAFASINLRNIYSFGMNYFIADWINTQGPLEVFSIIGGIHIFICLLTIPMYVYGKRVRSMTARLPFYKAIMSR